MPITGPPPSLPPEPVRLDEAFLDDPHAAYAGLHRRGGAVHRAVAPDECPVWLVTGYRAVHAAAADGRLALDKRHARSRGTAGDSLPPELDAHLLNSDGADHARLRRLTAAALGPRRIAGLRPRLRATVDGLLDPIAARGSGDLVGEFADPLAIAVICDLLGVPEADRVDFRSWTDTLLSPDPGAPARSREAMRAMLGFLADLTARKRRTPADDLLSDLIAAAGDGRLAEHELLAMLFLLLFAGYHNTAALVSSTVLALLAHPHHLAAVRTGRLDLADVTEEVLRWDSPAVLAVRRFPTKDMRLADRGLGAGDRVWLSWAAANRDPSVFPDPDVFDPTRAGPRHLAFGRGPHHCVGAALARLENEVAVEALLHRFPRLALAAEPGALGRRRSLRSGALTALPVTV
ncbi:cytochrome P450 [Kitasatospora paracochleata]|uniref:Cytochrome P450 n=1 Tax=Kitasatospora paracochleata TaxID=58354 RepID=A0ABT1J221_9ACTN|nr:cytochrome P450 [Kitasatospora paracochleata]MCP2311188.1 hypothetical protein [Kitasatospora paracochleata]